jgi:hypothetical protein
MSGEVRAVGLDWNDDPDVGAMHQSLPVNAEASRAADAKRNRTICLLYALSAALAVLSWQTATVHFNYGGNWSALFMTGDVYSAPPELPHTYIFPASAGYDGQFYRSVAHAPLFRADWARYFDLPRMRYYRILVPALAWLLAAGQGRLVDGAYIGVILCGVFLGTYWLALYAVEEGCPPAWGLAFLLLPATLVSIDRMTVDVALAALCVAFVRYTRKPSPVRLYLTLLLAPLVRDSGALLVAAQCGYDLFGKRWRRAAGYATAILPAAAWYIYVWNHVSAMGAVRTEQSLRFLPRWMFKYPGVGIVMELFRGDRYPFSPWLNRTLQWGDALTLCGFLALMAAGIWSLRKRPWDVEQWAIVGFVLLALATSTPTFWRQVYSYGRPFSPLIFLAALRPLRCGAVWELVPVSLFTLRVLVQMAPQAAGIAHGLF